MTITVDVVPDLLAHVSAWGTAAAAIGTVFAVGVAVFDSRQANKRAEAAEDETRRVRESQSREREDAHAAAWADRAALFVSAKASIPGLVTGDLHSKIDVRVDNDSGNPIWNVRLVLQPPHAPYAGSDGSIEAQTVGRWDSIASNDSEHLGKMIYVGPDEFIARRPRVTLLFDDDFGNRWRLTPDRSLLLSRRRLLGVDPSPINESSLDPNWPSVLQDDRT